MIPTPTRAAALAALTLVAACGSDGSPASPTPTPSATLIQPVMVTPSMDQQLDTLRPTLTVRNNSGQTTGATYEFQIADTTGFVDARTSHISGYTATLTQGGVGEGSGGSASLALAEDLQPATLFYWRARAVQNGTPGPWSEVGRFRSRITGFMRAGELYDPLVQGETVGERVGPTTFVPGRGLQLDTGGSFVRYRLPATVSVGEYSMDVEGLRANAPGDKAKVLGMQQGDSDFITNDYRIDVQYRGTGGSPPNAIQWRVIYGDADDLSVRYEPDTAKRFASVLLLDPGTTYHWKFSWGPAIRLEVSGGGIGGSSLYDYGLPAARGVYDPNPHVAYLGAPIGRSGGESASIAGTVYRNVWLSARPRPVTLGSAITGR